jgi:hypothetical protein
MMLFHPPFSRYYSNEFLLVDYTSHQPLSATNITSPSIKPQYLNLILKTFQDFR